MKPVKPPLVVFVTSIPISLLVLWWIYKKRVMKDEAQNDLEPNKNTKRTHLTPMDHTKNGLISNETKMKKSDKICEVFPVPKTQTPKDEPNIEKLDGSSINTQMTCDRHVEIDKIVCPCINGNDGVQDQDNENEKFSAEKPTEQVQTENTLFIEDENMVKLPEVCQQDSLEFLKRDKKVDADEELDSNGTETVRKNVSTSLVLSPKDDTTSKYSIDDTKTEQALSNLFNSELLKNIDTNSKQNISKIEQSTQNGHCNNANNGESISLSEKDTHLSEIIPDLPTNIQEKIVLSMRDSTSPESVDDVDLLKNCNTEEDNSSNYTFDSSENSLTSSQTISSNGSNLKNSNEQNNNSVNAESKISTVVNGIDDQVSMTGDNTQLVKDSTSVLNNHENEHLNKCNGENHSNLDNSDDSSCFNEDERQIYLEFPSEKVGLLIGRMGRNIKQLKQESGADIMVHTVPFRDDIQVLQIVGPNASVDMAASNIQKRFREVHLKEFEYAQTMDLMSPNSLIPSPPTSSSPSFAYPVPEMTQLRLPDGISVEVVVSAIADCDCIFVQQYTHPTFHALTSLEHAMSLCYSSPSTPALLSPVQVGLVCVAQHMDTWYRAQVIHSNEDSDDITIKFVDYGGYSTVPTSTVKQIRADFITLPFQAAECYLDNIAPPLGNDSYGSDSTRFLQEILKDGEFHAAISRYRDDGVPCIRLYKKHANRTTLVNDILVNEGIARWVAADDHSSITSSS